MQKISYCKTRFIYYFRNYKTLEIEDNIVVTRDWREVIVRGGERWIDGYDYKRATQRNFVVLELVS